MNQEKISKIIKDIRIKNNLTQEDLAKKYNVSTQAVSKWETKKSIPDIETLSKILSDYNISMDNLSKKRNAKKYLIITLIFIVLIGVIIFLMLKKDTFEFKKITTTCSNFEISGNIAYDKNSSHLHLSNITYCGEDENNSYINIECRLYEQNGKTIRELANCDYKENKKITLEEFLKNIDLSIKDFSTRCSSYDENSLYIEINATNEANKTINYKIPLIMSDECK